MFLLPRPPDGEMISNQFWLGPGSSSLHTAATNLTSVAQQVQAVLTGHQANSGVMQVAWQGQTGELANAADTPHQAWLAATVAQLEGASAATQGLATSFDTAQMATPHPAAFAANDAQYPVVVGLMLATLGIMWQPYVANGMEYLAMTAMAEAADKAYKAASGTILGTMQPLALTPPPISGTPAPGAGSFSAGMAGSPLGSLLQSASGIGASPSGAASAATAALPAVGAATQPLSSATSLLSQPTSALASSGSQLASTAGPMASSPAQAASGLGGMPASAMSPVGSQGNGAGGPGTSDGTWHTAAPATVAAALTPGGGVGAGGFGGAGAAMAPLRAPGAWTSSTPNVAIADADQGGVSRFAQTRAAMAGSSPTSGGMGSPGTMMPPAARQGQESAAARDKALDAALATAAVLYRPPRDMPVVTGAAGMHYLAGEEDQ